MVDWCQSLNLNLNLNFEGVVRRKVLGFETCSTHTRVLAFIQWLCSKSGIGVNSQKPLKNPWSLPHGPWTMECASCGDTPSPPLKVASRQKLTFAREIQIAEFRLVSHDDCATFRTIDLQHGAMNERILKIQRLFQRHQCSSSYTNHDLLVPADMHWSWQLVCDTKSF